MGVVRGSDVNDECTDTLKQHALEACIASLVLLLTFSILISILIIILQYKLRFLSFLFQPSVLFLAFSIATSGLIIIFFNFIISIHIVNFLDFNLKSYY